MATLQGISCGPYLRPERFCDEVHEEALYKCSAFTFLPFLFGSVVFIDIESGLSLLEILPFGPALVANHRGGCRSNMQRTSFVTRGADKTVLDYYGTSLSHPLVSP